MANDDQDLEPRQDTSTSLVLNNGLKLLSLVAKTNGQLSLRDVGRKLGLSPAVTHRLVSTLRNQKYLERNPLTGKYVVGLESFIVGRSYADSTGMDAVAKPILENAAKHYKVNCFMGVRNGSRIIYLYDVSGAKRASVRIAPGTEVPLHVTSMGLSILAQWPDGQLDEFVRQLGAEGQEDVSLLTERIGQQVRFARAHGYSQLRSEVFPGVVSVGAAIPGLRTESEMAISFGVRADSIGESDLAMLGEGILVTVKRIQVQLQKAL